MAPDEERSLLRRFFEKRLKSSPALDPTPNFYDGNTPFDLLYYRLQEEAVRHWQRHYGYVPPLGRIHHAFFHVHFAKMRAPGSPWRRRLRLLFRQLRLFFST